MGKKGTGIARNHGFTRKATPYPNEPYSSDVEQFSYAAHYRKYVTLLAYQLFEWKNLPDSIDPRYLEMILHTDGKVGFFYDKERGFMVSRGAEGQGIDHYRNPKKFHANETEYQKMYDILSYDDDDDDTKAIMIYNNDLKFPTLSSLYMFADEMADIRQISRVNRRAQKTPYIVQTTDKKYYSLLNAFQQVNENNQVIFTDKDLDFENALNVLQTQAPFVVDKLRTEGNNVWNEIMTFLSINNANIDGEDRTQAAEVYANNAQVDSSGNVFLKNRQEFCKRANRVFKDKLAAEHGDIEVGIRQDIVRQFELNAQKSSKDTGGGIPNGID